MITNIISIKKNQCDGLKHTHIFTLVVNHLKQQIRRIASIEPPGVLCICVMPFNTHMYNLITAIVIYNTQRHAVNGVTQCHVVCAHAIIGLVVYILCIISGRLWQSGSFGCGCASRASHTKNTHTHTHNVNDTNSFIIS